MSKTLKALSILLLINICLVKTTNSIEISLKETKGESGTVGYVDIERVFREYSGTLSARENFQKEIKDKEELINIKKSDIFSLKAEIAKLRQEREFALRLPLLIKQQEEINKMALSVAQTSSQAIVSTETGTAPIQGQPLDTTDSTETVSQVTSISTGTLVIPSTRTVSVIDMPGINNVPLNFFKFEVSTSVPEIDEAISKKEAELKIKEAELKDFQRRIELELLQYESNETEIILGKIYIALKELAIKEGISVVVDKRNILFGHSAVDLTDKLLEKLEKSEL